MRIRSTLAYAKAKKIWRRTVPFTVGTAALGLDQATKYIVNQELAVGQKVAAAPFLDIHHVKNTAVPGLSILLLGLAAALYLYKKATTAQEKVMASLFIAGTLGNLIERLGLQEVTDFIKFSFYSATFNFADVFIYTPLAWAGAILVCTLVTENLPQDK